VAQELKLRITLSCLSVLTTGHVVTLLPPVYFGSGRAWRDLTVLYTYQVLAIRRCQCYVIRSVAVDSSISIA
jgi:hypothetical protein